MTPLDLPPPITSGLRWLRVAAIGGVAGLAVVAVAFAALAVRPAREPAPVAAPAGRVQQVAIKYAVFIGDASAQGAGASSPSTRWVTLLSAAQDWEPSNLAKGGTGFIVTAGPEACGQVYCPNFQEMVAVAVEGAPDTIVVAAGLSDLPLYSTESSVVQDAITAAFTGIRESLPETRIIAVGPLVVGTESSTEGALESTISEAARGVDGTFVSLTSPDLLAEDGLVDDAGNLTDAGHAALATRVATVIGEG